MHVAGGSRVDEHASCQRKVAEVRRRRQSVIPKTPLDHLASGSGERFWTVFYCGHAHRQAQCSANCKTHSSCPIRTLARPAQSIANEELNHKRSLTLAHENNLAVVACLLQAASQDERQCRPGRVFRACGAKDEHLNHDSRSCLCATSLIRRVLLSFHWSFEF